MANRGCFGDKLQVEKGVFQYIKSRSFDDLMAHGAFPNIESVHMCRVSISYECISVRLINMIKSRVVYPTIFKSSTCILFSDLHTVIRYEDARLIRVSNVRLFIRRHWLQHHGELLLSLVFRIRCNADRYSFRSLVFLKLYDIFRGKIVVRTACAILIATWYVHNTCSNNYIIEKERVSQK